MKHIRWTAMPPAPTLNPAEYRALAEFRLALRTYLAFSESATRTMGVTAQHYQALLAIKANPDTTLIRDLAHQMLLSHHNAVQLVDRLVEAGLVRRNPSKLDGRAVELHLTAKGERTIAYLAAIHYREFTQHRAALFDVWRGTLNQAS